MADQPHTGPDVLDRARTPLLTLITQESLDQDYVTVAVRRAPREGTDGTDASGGSKGRVRVAVVAVVALFALLVTVAAVQTSRNAEAVDESRETLIERSESRRAAVRAAQADLAELQAENAEIEARLIALSDELNEVQGELLRLEGQAGFAPVTGEGIRITVDNAENADTNSMVRDSDLAMLTNALWEAGAEAVAINNQRISSVSAIRNVDTVIKVNFAGLAPPYTVLAIGDRSTLASDSLLGTGSGLAFASLANQYGFRYSVDNVDDIRVPAAPQQQRRLRSAVQGNGEDTRPGRLEGGTS